MSASSMRIAHHVRALLSANAAVEAAHNAAGRAGDFARALGAATLAERDAEADATASRLDADGGKSGTGAATDARPAGQSAPSPAAAGSTSTAPASGASAAAAADVATVQKARTLLARLANWDDPDDAAHSIAAGTGTGAASAAPADVDDPQTENSRAERPERSGSPAGVVVFGLPFADQTLPARPEAAAGASTLASASTTAETAAASGGTAQAGLSPDPGPAAGTMADLGSTTAFADANAGPRDDPTMSPAASAGVADVAGAGDAAAPAVKPDAAPPLTALSQIASASNAAAFGAAQIIATDGTGQAGRQQRSVTAADGSTAGVTAAFAADTSTGASAGTTPAALGTPGGAAAPSSAAASTLAAATRAMPDQLLGMVSSGARELTMRLHPAELGEISVRIAVAGHDVSAWFGSPLAQVQNAVSDAMGQLQAALAGAGYNLSGAWVGADASGAQQQGSPASPVPPRSAAALVVSSAAAGSSTAQTTAGEVSLYV